MRVGYEWEQEEDIGLIRTRRINELKLEIKRIMNTTLRGNFVDPKDREYWEVRLKKLNSELNSWEQQK